MRWTAWSIIKAIYGLMGRFDFKRRTNSTIDFSDEKIELLSKLTDELGDTLIKLGLVFYVDHLSQLRVSAKKRDKERFEKLVVSPELFGGSGALWEIWIEDNEIRQKFEQQFCALVDHLKRIGIRNGRIDQVRSGFNV